MVEHNRADSEVDFDRVIKKLLKKKIDWGKFFPKKVKTDTPDIVKDLMPLKMGFFYNHITK